MIIELGSSGDAPLVRLSNAVSNKMKNIELK